MQPTQLMYPLRAVIRTVTAAIIATIVARLANWGLDLSQHAEALTNVTTDVAIIVLTGIGTWVLSRPKVEKLLKNSNLLSWLATGADEEAYNFVPPMIDPEVYEPPTAPTPPMIDPEVYEPPTVPAPPMIEPEVYEPPTVPAPPMIEPEVYEPPTVPTPPMIDPVVVDFDDLEN